MKALGLPFGASFIFWFIMGLLRLFFESRENKKNKGKKNVYKISDIAVVLPAHNEEVVIKSSIRALKQSLHANQIYVVSDGSTDDTYRLAVKERVNAIELKYGRGKAKAMVHLISAYNLFERYKLIFIVDADTKIDRYFVERALPLFNDPITAVVFGSARIYWPRHIMPKLKLYYISYRERLNRILQYFLIYGMTWKYSNATFVIPGFATIYRSDILKQLEIDTPGLLIEDFNLAFQLHRKGLGKIGYNPKCIGWDQHPDNLKDYWKQVRRWNIGFFQTVRVNGIWPSFFQVALLIFSFEVFLNSIFILFLPFLILFLVSPYFGVTNPLLQNFNLLYQYVGPFKNIDLLGILLGVFVMDFVTSFVIGVMNKKPQFIMYGIFFYFMHYVTALILVSSLIPGFFKSSSGRWISPTRRNESVAI